MDRFETGDGDIKSTRSRIIIHYCMSDFFIFKSYARLPAILHLFVHMHGLSIAVCEDTMGTPLSANTGLLMAGEECLWDWLGEAVDEDIASFDALRNLLRMLDILREDRSAETGIRVVRTNNDLLLV